MHWTVPADLLRPHLPPGVTLDLWRGQGVASLVAFEVEGPAPRALLHTTMAAHYVQLNLRTYVEGPEGPGMTLLETRLDRMTYALGARLLGMPYHLDRELAYEVDNVAVSVRARGLSIRGQVEVAPARTMAKGTLEWFADERYRAYVETPLGRTLCIEVAHPPWRARPVVLEGSVTPEPLGLPWDGAPRSAQLCEDVEVVVEHVRLPNDAVDDAEPVPA